jgi:hypothetical protein
MKRLIPILLLLVVGITHGSAFAGSGKLMLKCKYTSSGISHWDAAAHKRAEVILVFPDTEIGTYVKVKGRQWKLSKPKIWKNGDVIGFSGTNPHGRMCGNGDRLCWQWFEVDRDTGYFSVSDEQDQETQIRLWGDYIEWRGVLFEYYCEATTSVIP